MWASRIIVVSALVRSVGGAPRFGIDLGSACGPTPDSVWNLTQIHGDGSTAITLAAHPQCMGFPNMANAALSQLTTDTCDGAPTRLWQRPTALGSMRNVGTSTCLETSQATIERASCGRLAYVPALPLFSNVNTYGNASASSENAGQGAWHAFDGEVSGSSGVGSWKTAGGYGIDGWPTTTVSTLVSGESVAGHWVQLSVAPPVVVSSYSLLLDGDHVPGRRGHPRSHVLCGAATQAGPWTTIGRVVNGTINIAATTLTFTSTSMQAFSVFRLVVTRVHRMGDGSAQLGELRLTSNSQLFIASAPETATTPVVAWTTKAVDAWGGPALVAEVLHGTVDVGYAMNASTRAGRYAAAVAAHDAMNATQAAYVSWSLVNGNIQEGAAGTSTILSTSFVASSSFVESVSIWCTTPAALFMYDISTGAVWESTSADANPVPFTFVGGRSYQVLNPTRLLGSLNNSMVRP